MNKVKSLLGKIHVSKQTKISLGVTAGLLIAGITLDSVLKAKGLVDADVSGDVPDISSLD